MPDTPTLPPGSAVVFGVWIEQLEKNALTSMRDLFTEGGVLTRNRDSKDCFPALLHLAASKLSWRCNGPAGPATD